MRFYHAKIEYELFLYTDKSTEETADDLIRVKIFNESDFVEVLLNNFTQPSKNVHKLKFESKKIGAIEGVQFLDNIAEVPVPEWTIRKVRIVSNSVNYEFVTNLFLPDIRYKPNETKSVFINSITSDYDPNSLKLEILTGANFITAYTTLDLEFFTLRGNSTGKITIPAEEVRTVIALKIWHNFKFRPKQHKVYNIGGVNLDGQPISELRVNCPSQVFISEVKIFCSSIHDQSESFIVDHLFPGEKKSSIKAQYSKYSCTIQAGFFRLVSRLVYAIEL